ncbi:MAG TPA: protein TolR [Nitrospirae bacterium]|nr:biopolymer transport protein ExbD [bacterium BMS3Abin09]GBE41773.1 biopolymer transport protein ExbD [bacterium BMS3Bbin09]HDH34448.1 protein TolR [Nitrospirota bacterium]HDN94990.1 protein TolR [Nitrospirota bacterium]HDO66624.1 protein TolR [Nitrospirota bacterium]
MQRRRQALSEINVTPFVDVMLVLLIIFMVTAPLLQQGIDVDLPQAKGKEMSPAERTIITVKKDGKIYLDKVSVTMKALSTTLSKNMNREVFLKADKDVPYGMVVTIMGELRSVGIEKLGMITEPTARIR